MGGHGINGKNSLEQEGPYKGRMYNASCTERKALRWHMVEGCRGLELGALPEYTPPLPRAGPGANVSHEVAMILIDGKQTARDIRAELKAQVEAAVSAGRRAPGLAVILVGEDPASQVYVRNKERACAEAGILSFPYRLPADTTQEALLALIAELNGRDDVDGILLQLPLPKHLSASACLLAIDPAKDVDGFHPENVGRLSLNLPGMVSCTPAGVIELLRRYNLPTRGKKAVVLGRSDIVGKPLALLLARPGEIKRAHLGYQLMTDGYKAKLLHYMKLFNQCGKA